MRKSDFRKAYIFFKGVFAGILEETAAGYRFSYESDFLKDEQAISVSLPATNTVYESDKLFPFFAGLLPEGWYLDIVSKKLKVDKQDSFGLLLASCRDTAGAVEVKDKI
jgi:serine/threonine-protein kinase HipA